MPSGFSINLALPDLWQQEAVRHLKAGCDVIVDAPTGAGKTHIFELYFQSGALSGQAIYTVPTRALANDKRNEWAAKGWNVGIATGDVAENLSAPVLVATLETQRENFLRGSGPRLLVVDEYQMLADPVRGLNYELALALAPAETQLLLLSGSVANAPEVAAWLGRLGRRVEIVRTTERPVPLDEVASETLPHRAPRRISNFWPRLAGDVLMANLGPLLIFAPHRLTATGPRPPRLIRPCRRPGRRVPPSPRRSPRRTPRPHVHPPREGSARRTRPRRLHPRPAL